MASWSGWPPGPLESLHEVRIFEAEMRKAVVEKKKWKDEKERK